MRNVFNGNKTDLSLKQYNPGLLFRWYHAKPFYFHSIIVLLLHWKIKCNRITFFDHALLMWDCSDDQQETGQTHKPQNDRLITDWVYLPLLNFFQQFPCFFTKMLNAVCVITVQFEIVLSNCFVLKAFHCKGVLFFFVPQCRYILGEIPDLSKEPIQEC